MRHLRPRTIATVLAAVALCTGVAACGGSGGDASLGPADDVAIQVGAQTITNGEIERRALFLAKAQDPTTGRPAEPPPKDSKEFKDFRLTAAGQLVDERVFMILAQRCGTPCEVTEKEIDKQVKDVEDNSFAGSRADLEKALADRGITLSDYRASLRASQQEQLLTSRVEKRVEYTDAQALAYYRKNIAQYRLQAEKRLSHILVGSRAEATALRAELTPDNFARLARERSTDPAAKRSGGDLGPLASGGLIPEIAAVAQTLKPGVVSEPVESQFGWHLLLVRDVKARTKTFDEVKGQIVEQQLQVAQAAAVQKWRDTVFKKQKDAAKYLNKKVEPAAPATPTTTTGATTSPSTTSTSTPNRATTTAPTSTGGTTVTAPTVPVTPTSTSGPATP